MHDDSAPSSWRRPLLLLAGTTLLTLGAAMTWVRVTTPVPEGDTIAGVDETEPQASRVPFAPPAENTDDEAGGIGVRHKGEEGRMGRPTSKAKRGQYAMKGPRWPAGPIGTGLVSTGSARPPELGAELRPGLTATADDHVSTFSVDVDTASYSLVRRALQGGLDVPTASVRLEEMINYFDYDYPAPDADADVPFSVTTELGACPWNPDHSLLQVGLRGKQASLPPGTGRNLVLLIDTSGSMRGPDRLGLIQRAVGELTEHLSADDRISIVTYASDAGLVLPPTPGDRRAEILDALETMHPGGGTHGSGGIDLAYATAQSQLIEGGINRVVLMTDGDFNVGVSDHDELVAMIERKREAGVSLSVLGFGFGNMRDGTMEQLADHGNGNYAYIDSIFEARKVFIDEASSTFVTIAKDVKLQTTFDPDRVASFRLVGYDNRILADEDFADDRKDAGEVGAGHTVTALYEVQLRDDADTDGALGSLAIRYKAPDGDTSEQTDIALSPSLRPMSATTDRFRFAAAVAQFGMLLRGGEERPDASTYADVMELAAGARGRDAHCYRAEFLDLVAVAARRADIPLDAPRLSCVPSADPEVAVAVASSEAADEVTLTQRARQWVVSIPDVLHLLPPLLALPFFVLAWRQRRRPPHDVRRDD